MEQAKLDLRMSDHFSSICKLYKKAIRSPGCPEIRRFLLNDAFGGLDLFVSIRSLSLSAFSPEEEYDKDFLSAVVEHGSAMSFWETLEQLEIREITGEEAGRRLVSEGLKKANQLRKLDLDLCDEYSIAHYLNSGPLLSNLRTLSVEIEDHGYRNSLLSILPTSVYGMKPFKTLTTLAIKSSEDFHINPADHQELLKGSFRPAKFPALQHLDLNIYTREFKSFWPFIVVAAPLLQTLNVNLISSRWDEESAVTSMSKSACGKSIEFEHLHTVSLSCRFSDIPLLWYDTPGFAPCLSNFHLTLVDDASNMGMPGAFPSSLHKFIADSQKLTSLEHFHIELPCALEASLVKEILSAFTKPSQVHLYFSGKFDASRRNCPGCKAFPSSTQRCFELTEECSMVADLLQMSCIDCTIELWAPGTSSKAGCEWCRTLDEHGMRLDQVLRMNGARVGLM